MLESLSDDFIAELQGSGAFVEYNQQVIVASGESSDYVSCIVKGRAKIFRIDADYAKANVALLETGDWFGEANIFERVRSNEEVFAHGEVIVWTIAADTVRKLLFERPEGVQFLFNIAGRFAQEIARQSEKRRALAASQA